MTSKPYNANAHLPTPANPPSKTAAPTYNDAFANFLTRKTNDTEMTSKPNPLTVKVITQPVNPPPKVLPVSTSVITNVSPLQKKQEEWTQMVLQQNQTQQTKAGPQNQRVMTERIHPYTKPVFANQAKGQQQVYYTIVNSNKSTSLTAKSSIKSQGFEQKQQPG